MGFFDAVYICLRKYAVFTGRAPRSEYWWFFLFKTLLLIVGLTAIFQVSGSDASRLMLVLNTVGIGYLLLLLPSIAVAVRRLHDWNMSGWMYLLVLIPYIGWLIVLVLMIPKSTPDENRYGPIPFAPADFEVFD